MARLTLDIEVHVRWWVRPYLAALYVFICAVSPFTDEERIADFIVAQFDMIKRRGIKTMVI